MPTMRELGLDKVSADERTLLGHELLQIMEAETGSSELTAAQEADLVRRLERYRDEPMAGSSWEEVKIRLLGES